MEELKTPGSLELEEDLRFERLEWRVARVTWVALLVLMGATLAGVFGGGPLSSATASATSGSLRVEYPRFVRYGASLRFLVHARAGSDGRVPLTLSRSFVRAFRIDQITPAPVQATAVEDGVQYLFEAEPGNPAALIIFEAQSAERWLVRGGVRSGGQSLLLTQLVYP